jgi:hypothetical protein
MNPRVQNLANAGGAADQQAMSPGTAMLMTLQGLGVDSSTSKGGGDPSGGGGGGGREHGRGNPGLGGGGLGGLGGLGGGGGALFGGDSDDPQHGRAAEVADKTTIRFAQNVRLRSVAHGTYLNFNVEGDRLCASTVAEECCQFTVTNANFREMGEDCPLKFGAVLALRSAVCPEKLLASDAPALVRRGLTVPRAAEKWTVNKAPPQVGPLTALWWLSGGSLTALSRLSGGSLTALLTAL